MGRTIGGFSGSFTYSHLISEGEAEKEISVTISFSGYFQRGRYQGPPENCYPDEGEINLEKVENEEDGTTVDFDDFAKKLNLTKGEISKIEELAWEAQDREARDRLYDYEERGER